LEQVERNVTEQYGQVSIEAFKKLQADRDELLKPYDATTLRENYNVGVNQCFGFRVKYTCSCECGFAFTFEHEETVPNK
jgi:hypothetical protein